VDSPWNDALHARLLAGMRSVSDYQIQQYGRLAPASFRLKSGHSDLVTAVDTESETRLSALLSELLPRAAQLGEEGLRRDGEGGDALTWIVDPLDGTTNYAHEHPFFCIAVALVAGREPLLGVIHAPRLGETFHGWGGRAWLGERPLTASTRGEATGALFATGFADRRQGRADVNLGNMSRVIHASRGVRRAGSAALDLAFTAAGRLDGFWEMGLNPWDVAAGIYLVRAAGGRVSDFRGGEDALAGDQIVASNGRVHDWLLGQLELAPAFDRSPADLFPG